MALPSSGEISFNLFNTDRSIASGTEVNMATAGTAYSVSYTTDGSNQLGMDEFYGKSTATPTPSPTPPPPSPTPSPTPPPPSPTPSPTPAPAVTFDVSYDCNGTSGTSGRVFITNIQNGGSACYVGVSVNSGAPSMYATTSIGGATSATITGIADYAYSYSVYVYNSTSLAGARVGLPSGAINCYVAPTPPPPSPTPAPVYYIALSTGNSACEAKQNYTGPMP